MAPDGTALPRPPVPLGPRGIVLLSILAAGIAAFAALGLSPADLP